jgi:hypothetical protein
VLNISSIENIGLDRASTNNRWIFFEKISNNFFSLENRATQHQLLCLNLLSNRSITSCFCASIQTIQKEKQELLLKIKKQEISVQQAAKFLVQKHLK